MMFYTLEECLIIMVILSSLSLIYNCYSNYRLNQYKREKITIEKFLITKLAFELELLDVLCKLSKNKKCSDKKVYNQLISIVALINVIIDKCDELYIDKKTLNNMRNNTLKTLETYRY